MVTSVTGFSPTDTPTPEFVHEVFAIVFGLIVLLGFVGNMSVMVIVVADWRMRNAANTLLASLALVDLLFCTICLPFIAVAYSTEKLPSDHTWCKVSHLRISVNTFIKLCSETLLLS